MAGASSKLRNSERNNAAGHQSTTPDDSSLGYQYGTGGAARDAPGYQ